MTYFVCSNCANSFPAERTPAGGRCPGCRHRGLEAYADKRHAERRANEALDEILAGADELEERAERMAAGQPGVRLTRRGLRYSAAWLVVAGAALVLAAPATSSPPPTFPPCERVYPAPPMIATRFGPFYIHPIGYEYAKCIRARDAGRSRP